MSLQKAGRGFNQTLISLPCAINQAKAVLHPAIRASTRVSEIATVAAERAIGYPVCRINSGFAPVLRRLLLSFQLIRCLNSYALCATS
jgi:hypothetical protein